MIDSFPNTTQQIPKEKNITFGAPHVFLLGAGASKAALPNGDANGKEIPLMRDLPRVCQLSEIDPNISQVTNFESYYSDIKDKSLKNRLATKIEEYFVGLKLPKEATIYDYLVLSLRKKDMIATFNWDPFLYQACCRNYKVAEMPHIAYLHGSVAIGYCLKDSKQGPVGYPCSKCGVLFSKSKLLYPVKKKNYNDDPAIKKEWSGLESFLKHAYMFTIFGYSAPKTDVEAIELLKKGWGDPQVRKLEEIEIISTTPKEELANTWKDFIHTHHYGTTKSFYESWTWIHPRRTCESLWEALMQASPYHDTPPPKISSLLELQHWFKKNLVKYE
jgi:hypothetical protein